MHDSEIKWDHVRMKLTAIEQARPMGFAKYEHKRSWNLMGKPFPVKARVGDIGHLRIFLA